MKRVRLVLTNIHSEEDVSEGHKIVQELTTGAWTGFVSRGSQIHCLKGGQNHGEAMKIVDGLVAGTKEEEYQGLQGDFQALVDALGQSEMGKKVLKTLDNLMTHFRILVADDHSAQARDYSRIRERFVTVASIIREKLKIRVGEQFLAFLTKATPQATTAGNSLQPLSSETSFPSSFFPPPNRNLNQARQPRRVNRLKLLYLDYLGTIPHLFRYALACFARRQQ
jgi:hypothetical protein